MASLGYHCLRLGHFEERVVANGLRRAELFQFPLDQLPRLKEMFRRHNLAVSIHTPLVRPLWYPVAPTWSFLCYLDGERRELTLRMVDLTLEAAAELEAEYVVVHFPAPCGEGDREHGAKELEEVAWDSARRLAEMSEEHGVDIHFEGFGPSPFLGPSFIIAVARAYPNLRYCFDIAHMHIAAQRDGFDYYAFAEEVGPFIGSVHLWNTRHLEDYQTYRHIPVHPSQKPEKGWVDVPRILSAILRHYPSCPLIFEYGPSYPPALGDHDVKDGVRWIKDIVATLSS